MRSGRHNAMLRWGRPLKVGLLVIVPQRASQSLENLHVTLHAWGTKPSGSSTSARTQTC